HQEIEDIDVSVLKLLQEKIHDSLHRSPADRLFLKSIYAIILRERVDCGADFLSLPGSREKSRLPSFHLFQSLLELLHAEAVLVPSMRCINASKFIRSASGAELLIDRS